MLREVVEEPYFTEEFDSYRNIYSEMDDVHAAITFTLSENPRIGALIEGFPHPTTRLFKTASRGETPGFRVLYRYTDTQVILLSIDKY